MKNQELDNQIKEIYRKAYAKVHTPESLRRHILQFAGDKKEDRLQGMIFQIDVEKIVFLKYKKRHLKSVLIVVAAIFAIFISSNAISHMVYGYAWIEKIINSSIDKKDVAWSQLVKYQDDKKYIIYEQMVHYTYYKENRIYFQFQGMRTDITEACEDDQYYMFHFIDDEGISHIIVTGKPSEVEIIKLTNHGLNDINDSYYYGEFLFDENGEWLTTVFYGIGTNDYTSPLWQQRAIEDIMGEDWERSIWPNE